MWCACVAIFISSSSAKGQTTGKPAVADERQQDDESGVHSDTLSGPSVGVTPIPRAWHPQPEVKSKPSEEEKSKANGEGHHKPNDVANTRPKSERRILANTSFTLSGGYLDEPTNVNFKGCEKPVKQHLAEVRQDCEEQPAGYQVSEEVSEPFSSNLSGTALMVCGVWTCVM